MVLQSDVPFCKSAKVWPLLKLTFGNHFFPVFIPHFGIYYLCAIEPESNGAVFTFYFHIVPLTGRPCFFRFTGNQVVQITGAVLVNFRIRMTIVIQYLHLWTS